MMSTLGFAWSLDICVGLHWVVGFLSPPKNIPGELASLKSCGTLEWPGIMFLLCSCHARILVFPVQPDQNKFATEDKSTN